MHRRILISFGLIALLAASGCLGEKPVPSIDKWITHEKNNLSIKFPGAPKLEQQHPNAPPLGRLDVDTAVYEISKQKALISSQVKYPISPEQYDAAAGIDGVVEGVASELGKVDSTKTIEHNGLLARDVLISSKDGIFCRFIVVLDSSGPTLYQIQAIGDREFVDGQVSADFFGSLNITPIAN